LTTPRRSGEDFPPCFLFYTRRSPALATPSHFSLFRRRQILCSALQARVYLDPRAFRRDGATTLSRVQVARDGGVSIPGPPWLPHWFSILLYVLSPNKNRTVGSSSSLQDPHTRSALSPIGIITHTRHLLNGVAWFPRRFHLIF